jgi:cyclopropane fatty-acyl-phospholipid synthase-like methyltransferase
MNNPVDFFELPQNYLHKDYNVLVRRQLVHEMLGHTQDKVLLDIGCGDGRVSLQYARNNRLYLVDASESMLGLARINSVNQGNVTIIQSSLDEFNPPVLFDVVLALGLLAHLPSWQKGMQRLSSFLKPGGMLVVQISDASHPLVRMQIKPKGKRVYSLNAITPQKCKEVALKNSLIQAAIKRYGFAIPGIGLLPNEFLKRFTLVTARLGLLSRLTTDRLILFKKIL